MCVLRLNSNGLKINDDKNKCPYRDFFCIRSSTNIKVFMVLFSFIKYLKQKIAQDLSLDHK